MKELKVGDKIRVTNVFNNFIVEIIRVTKTQAIAKTPFNNEMKFKLKYSIYPDKSPRDKFSTTDYTVVK